MKKVIIISVLSFIASYSFAQSAYSPGEVNKVSCTVYPGMPANGVPVWPVSAYKSVEDSSCAPCYEYKNERGHTIMECPFVAFFLPANAELPGTSAAATVTEENGSVDIQTTNAYTGNYPACTKDRYPPHTTPVWPKSAYTPIGNPNCAPCYEYTSKRGTLVMECPYLVFTPEKAK